MYLHSSYTDFIIPYNRSLFERCFPCINWLAIYWTDLHKNVKMSDKGQEKGVCFNTLSKTLTLKANELPVLPKYEFLEVPLKHKVKQTYHRKSSKSTNRSLRSISNYSRFYFNLNFNSGLFLLAQVLWTLECRWTAYC